MRRQHEALTQRLLAVMRKIDLCEARVAPSLGLWDSSSAQAGQDISHALDGIERRLAPRAPRAPLLRLPNLSQRLPLKLRQGCHARIGPSQPRCCL